VFHPEVFPGFDQTSPEKSEKLDDSFDKNLTIKDLTPISSFPTTPAKSPSKEESESSNKSSSKKSSSSSPSKSVINED
jgi:hypothetical protein